MLTHDDIYARDLRRHRLVGRLLEVGHTAALVGCMMVAGVVVLGGWMVFLGGLVRL